MNKMPHPERTTEFCMQASQWAFDEYTARGYDVIFSTVHGSYLYGTAHEESDVDFYVVISEGKGKQKKYEDDTDVIVINLENFLERFWDGSHQAVEALYSPYIAWNDQSPYLHMMKSLKPSYGAFAKKCLSASKSFAKRSEETPVKASAAKLFLHAERLNYSAFSMLNGNYTLVWKKF